MTNESTVTAELARLVSSARFQEIPADVIDVAKTVILDDLSVTLGDGTVLKEACERQRGIWGNPLSREERLVKVPACAGRALFPTTWRR